MGVLLNRATVVSTCILERVQHGLPIESGPAQQDVLFILDGVGGFQFGPLMIRRALRQENSEITTVLYHWQYGLPGEVWTDLMWYRRNRVMGAKLARRLLAFRRAYPSTRIHVLAYSGGAGIAVFGCESLRCRPVIDSLILACPALAPEYNLGPALRAVRRGYALCSRGDTVLLGLGTRIFGTTDRKFVPAAGKDGFRIPADASDEDRRAYQRLSLIHWTPELKRLKHNGGHTGWIMLPVLRKHLVPMIKGKPLLPLHPVGEDNRESV